MQEKKEKNWKRQRFVGGLYGLSIGISIPSVLEILNKTSYQITIPAGLICLVVALFLDE